MCVCMWTQEVTSDARREQEAGEAVGHISGSITVAVHCERVDSGDCALGMSLFYFGVIRRAKEKRVYRDSLSLTHTNAHSCKTG